MRNVKFKFLSRDPEIIFFFEIKKQIVLDLWLGSIFVLFIKNGMIVNTESYQINLEIIMNVSH